MVDSLKGLFGGGEEDEGNAPDRRQGRRDRGDRADRQERREARRTARLQDDPDRQMRARDFVNRYTTGDPSEGYDDREAIEQFEYVRQNATPEQMRRAMEQTYENMNPNQRQAFAQMIEQRRAGQGMVDIQRSGGTGASSGGGGGLFDMLGGVLGGGAAGGTTGGGGFGGLLGGLLGGGSGGAGGGGLGDMFGGSSSETTYRRQDDQSSGGGGLGDLMSNPLSKVVLGGIAAYAMKEMMNQR